MKMVKRGMLGLVMLVLAAPVFAGQALQMWRCEMDDDATEEQVTSLTAEWLSEVRKLDGGANLDAYVYFPIAVNATGEMDMMFVVVAPSFTEWGKFWDAYAGSATAAELEKKNRDFVVCPDSVVWEAIKVQ